MTKNTPKRVMHLIASNFYGGPEKQILEHLKLLNKTKHYQGILCTFREDGKVNPLTYKAIEFQIENYLIDMPNPWHLNALKQLEKIVKSNKIDLIVAHHYKAVVLSTIISKKLNIPALNYSRGFTGENMKIKFYEWLERKFLKHMDGIISVSLGQQNKLKKLGIRNKNLWIVHNGVESNKEKLRDFDKARREIVNKYKIPGEAIISAIVGRLSPEKGHRFIIDAYKHYLNDRKNLYFLFCGDGFLTNHLKKLTNQNDIKKQFIFTGFINDMSVIYKAIDFLILPSITEGLPNVILESFSYKKPVIATKVGGVPEVVVNYSNGILVEKENPFQLAEAIKYFMKNQKELKKFGENGYKKVYNEFTYEQQTNKLIIIYNEILNQNTHVHAA